MNNPTQAGEKAGKIAREFAIEALSHADFMRFGTKIASVFYDRQDHREAFLRGWEIAQKKGREA